MPLIFLLAACATPVRDKESTGNLSANNLSVDNTTTEYAVTENYDIDAVDYTVKPGDRLSIIAKEITGQSSSWREIAAFNSIDDPRRLQPGTVLAIPTELILDYEKSNNVLIAQSEQRIPTPQAQSSSLGMRLNEVEDASVVVTPTYTNREFELKPIDPNAPLITNNSTRNYRGAETQIKVIGSYYPKGIYTEPASYSKLIFRAAPGTLFMLDRQVNDWYKIETASGSGYIRTSDAALVEKSE